MSSNWLFVLDLYRQVTGVLRPQSGGTGSTYGEQRVVGSYINMTGASLPLYTLVQLSEGGNDLRVKKVIDLDSRKVLGVVVGYFDGTRLLVEAAAADGSQVAVQTAGVASILIETAATRGQYAYAAATDGKIYSSATAAGGAFGLVVDTAETSAGATTARVVFPLTAASPPVVVAVTGGLDVIVTAPVTGVVCDIELPFAATWTAWRVFNDAAGSIQYDLWKDTYANFPPTVADTITASAKPLTSSANKAQNTTLTGWTTAFATGDVLRVNIDSTSGLLISTLSLLYTRT